MQINVLDHGFIRLVDSMPAENGGDAAILQAARVSYSGENIKVKSTDAALLRYLLRHDHMTPFEMVEFKFHCKMPKFVAAQWIRHRTANVNEYSARYSEVPDLFYIPNVLCGQSAENKQGSADELPNSAEMVAIIRQQSETAYAAYKQLLSAGVSREQARMVLPQNVYTEWYWKCDLRNIFNFLRLRMDSHAQWEIRVYANAMYDIVKTIAPAACQAFMDYHYNSVRFTAVDIAAINGEAEIKNKRELAEYKCKMAKLKFGVAKVQDE